MALVKLGWKPIAVQPIFSKGQDWIVTIEPIPGSPSPVWPVGTTVVAKIYPPDTDTRLPLASWTTQFSWPGVIAGDNLMFKAESADADLVLEEALIRIRVSFPNAPTTDDYTYCAGKCVRDD